MCGGALSSSPSVGPPQSAERELSDKSNCALKSKGHRDGVRYLPIGEMLARAVPYTDQGKKVTVGTGLPQEGSKGLLPLHRCPCVILPVLEQGRG